MIRSIFQFDVIKIIPKAQTNIPIFLFIIEIADNGGSREKGSQEAKLFEMKQFISSLPLTTFKHSVHQHVILIRAFPVHRAAAEDRPTLTRKCPSTHQSLSIFNDRNNDSDYRRTAEIDWICFWSLYTALQLQVQKRINWSLQHFKWLGPICLIGL